MVENLNILQQGERHKVEVLPHADILRVDIGYHCKSLNSLNCGRRITNKNIVMGYGRGYFFYYFF